MHLDTGSSDLWVNTPSSALCKSRRSGCQAAGTYNANSSSTYSYLNSNFNITYADESGAAGDYATDVVAFSGVTVKKQQFAIGYTSSSAASVLGIGYEADEASNTATLSSRGTYKNLPAQLAADGLIATNAYSVWLNDLQANKGMVLFGGIDKSQYVEPLVTIPVNKVGGLYAEFLVTLTGLKLGSTTIASNMALGVLLDTGTSLTYLPSEIVQPIFTALGATWIASQAQAYVPCSVAQQNITLDFAFSSPAAISVNLSELVLPTTDQYGQPLKFDDGSTACLLGLGPSASGTPAILGDTFLRSAYVVFDLVNNQVSLAQSKHAVETAQIVEIGSAGATAASNPVAAQSGVPSLTTADSGAGLTRPTLAPAMAAAAVAVGAFLL